MGTRVYVMLTLVALAGAGCATLFNESTKTVAMGSNPNEAEIWVGGVRMGVTPMSLDLDNHVTHTVVFRKEGFSDVACNLIAKVGARWVVLDVLGGLLPVIVDAATGAWRGLDQGACNVVLPAAGTGGAEVFGLVEKAREQGWVVFQRVEPAPE